MFFSSFFCFSKRKKERKGARKQCSHTQSIPSRPAVFGGYASVQTSFGLRKNAARKLNERSACLHDRQVKRRKLFESRLWRDEFFLRSGANDTSGIFSAALTFLVLFVSRQKEQIRIPE